MTFRSMDQIRQLNERQGEHFFDPASMKFFNSRVVSGVFAGGYFVTAERPDDPGEADRFTIRQAVYPSGHVHTVGDFREFATLEQARDQIRVLQEPYRCPVCDNSGPHDRTENGVAYDYDLFPNGARFTLLREPHHTLEDMGTALSEIRRDRDVIGVIKTVDVKAIY